MSFILNIFTKKRRRQEQNIREERIKKAFLNPRCILVNASSFDNKSLCMFMRIVDRFVSDGYVMYMEKTKHKDMFRVICLLERGSGGDIDGYDVESDTYMTALINNNNKLVTAFKLCKD